MISVTATPVSQKEGGDQRAQVAYDALAPFYDSFTSDYEYDGWLESLETWALAQGLRGRDVLDVACGTGKSFLPLLRKGYCVTGCDVSSEMVQRARAKTEGRAQVVVADMRALPWVSRFDLITCLDDAMNYLLTETDLRAALDGMWSALRHGGVLVFDTNSLGTYRRTFTASFEKEVGATRFRWLGTANSEMPPGSVCRATLEIGRPLGRVATRHVQRHWPIAALRAFAGDAGFGQVVFRGQVPGGRLVGEPDECRHSKVVCLAAKRSTASCEAHRSARE